MRRVLVLPAREKGQMTGSCDNGNKHLGVIQGGEFIDYLNDY
jgi:hypothetical protein